MSKVKAVSFKDKETELLEYIEDKDFSSYVKQLIKAEMKKNREVPIIEKKRRRVNFEL